MEEDTTDEVSGKHSSMSWSDHGVQPPAHRPRLPWVQVCQVLGPLLRLPYGTTYIGGMVSLPPTECVRHAPGHVVHHRSLKCEMKREIAIH